MGCSAIQNSWFHKSKMNRRVMGKQASNVYKRVTFTIILERVNNLCQLLNLLDSEVLYQENI